jgi:hypothetical protein
MICTMALNFISWVRYLVVIDTIAIQLSLGILTSDTAGELERKDGIGLEFSG